MKKLTKVLAILLVAISAFGLMTACQNDEYLTDEKGIYKLDEDGVKVYKVVMVNHGVTLGQNDFKYQELVNERINERLYQDLGYKVDFDVTVYSDADFANLLGTRLSDQEHIDIVRQTSTDLLKEYVRQGVAKDLTPYIQNATNLTSNIGQSAWQEVTVNDKIYAIPQTSVNVTSICWARGDFLEACGIVDENGEPRSPETLEELETFLQYAVDVKGQETGLAANAVPFFAIPSYVEDFLLPLFCAQPNDYIDEDGNLQPKYLQDGFKDYLAKVREWMHKGYLDSNLYSNNPSQTGAMLTARTTAMGASGIWDLEFGGSRATAAAHPEWKITGIFPLTTADGLYRSPTGLVSEYLFTPFSSKSTGVVIDLMNWSLFNEENYMLLTYGIEGTTYEIVDGAITVPEAEKSSSVSAPRNLIGSFTVGTNVEYNLKYASAGTDQAALDAYAKSAQIGADEMYVNPTSFVMSALSDTEKTALTALSSELDREIQKICELQYSDAEWEAAWEAALNTFKQGYGPYYEKMTAAYKEIFG